MMAPGDREFTKCVSNVITWSFSSVVRSANTALACTSLYYATSCQISVTLQLAIIYRYNLIFYPVDLELDSCREAILHC